jgi:DNA-binding beta-propeller fold protein YncE
MTTPFSASLRNSFVCFFLVLPFIQVTQAQTAHFSGVVSAIGSGFDYPSGAAVDSSGNVFVADTYNNAVKEIVAVNGVVTSGSTVITVGSGFSGPSGVAVSGAGNVFVADYSHNAVKEIVAVNGLVSASSTVITIGSGVSYPTGVTVDGTGDVFVADYGNNAAKEIVAVNGLVTSSSTVKTIGGGFNYPCGVAVDSAGNVFVADYDNSAVKEIVAVNGAVSSSSIVITIGSGFSYPGDVAVDNAGNVFVADTYNTAVKEIMTRGANFGSVPVATSTLTTLSLTFTFDAGGTVGIPAVLAQGASGLDFTDAGTGTCTTNGASHSYSTGDYCTVAVAFTPQYPSARLGAVQLISGSANVLATAYLDGLGIGSEVVFNPALTSAPLHSPLFNDPVALVVDGCGIGAGNIYIADENNHQILKVDPSGNVTVFAGTGVAGFSGDGGQAISAQFNSPADVVMDGAGNLYVADFSNYVVRKIDTKGMISTVAGIGLSYGDGGSGGLATATRLGEPVALAFDPQGNLYVVDYYDQKVRKINQAGIISTVAGTGVVGYSGDGAAATAAKLNYPLGARTDNQGNLYISDSYNNVIRKVDTTGTITTVAGHFNGGVSGYGGDGGPATSATLHTPYDLAIDAAGELFICDSGNSVLRRVDASGNISTYGTPLSFPEDAIVDGAGNLALIDSTAKALVTISRTQPATHSFGTLNVGSTSSAQTVNVLNIGNSALTFPVPSTGLNPSIAAGFAISNSSTCPQSSSSSNPATLAVGASCNELISFTPTVPGSVSGSLEMTDDSLDEPGLTYGTQTISLTGTATAPPVTATTTIPSAALTQGYATTPFIPVTGSGGAGTLGYGVSPALPVGLTFSATGTVRGTPSVIRSTATYTVTITDADSVTATSTFSLTVNPAIAATTASSSTLLTVSHAATAFTPVTASGGTGTLTYSVSPALPSGLTFTSAGVVSGTPTVVSVAATYTVTVTDTNSASSTATFSLTVSSTVVVSTVIASSVLTQGHIATAFTPVTATGGTGTLTDSVSPALPAGLVFSSTGTVSGTSTAASAATTYTVTVTDTNGASSTATFGLTVNAPITTSTAVASSSLTPAFGAAVVLTATVAPAPADNPPGRASFYTGSTLLGTAALNPKGVATLSIALPLGPNTITAVYSGSASDAGSTSSALSISDRTGTSVTIFASPTTQLYNNPIVLTAQASSPTAGTLTGTVSFLDGTTVIATVPLGANGQATYSVATLADGSHSLTAAYSGDPKFKPSGSTGAAVAITVSDVNLNLGGDQNHSVVPGGAVAYAFPLSPLVTPTFLYDVHLTATGLPPGATYTFSLGVIPAGSGSMPVTLTVQTAKGTATLSMPVAPGQHSSRGLTALAFGLLLPLFGAKSVRRRLKAMPKPLAMSLFAVLSTGAMVAVSGCGSGGFFGATSTSGNYTITVTATSADLVRTSTVQLTIQ